MSFPTWANLGPANGGTGAVTVSWPVNYATNDIGVLICQSSNEAVTETSGGWTQIASSPQGVGTPGAAGSTRITVFWKRVTNGGSEAPAQLADSGDHTNGIIAVIRGCPSTGDPVDASAGGTEATIDASLDATGPTTVTKDCLVLIAACHALDTTNPEWSGEAAPGLTTLIERYDKSITIGNGGGTAIWAGNFRGPGAVGAFSAVGDVATVKAWVMLAFKPKPKLLNTNPITASSGPWQPANPGAGGTWAHVCAGPTGIIAVAADLAGVYLSTDRGNSWTNCGNKRGLNEQFIHAVAHDPWNGNIIYAASAHGVYRTQNAGESWTLVSSDLWIADIVVSEFDANIVYAATYPSQPSIGANAGIIKSVNRGLTFSVVADDLPANIMVNRLSGDPRNSTTLYIVSSFHDFNHAPDDSVFKSTNGGANWTRVSGTLEAAGTVWDFNLDRSAPDTLWATTYTGDPYNTPFVWAGSVWKSIDAGGSWTAMAAHTGNVMVKYGGSNTIWVVDNKRNEGASEEGFWESTDGGVTFAKKSTLGDYDFGWQANADRAYGAGNYGICHGFGQDLSDPDTVLQISPQFVHGSFDAGLIFYNLYTYQVTENHWQTRRLENLTIADVRVGPTGVVFTGAFDTGMWRSFDNGLSWETCNSADFTGDWNGEGGNTCTIVPDPTRANVVWAAQGRTETTSNLVKSTETAEAGSWLAANSGLPADRFVYGLSVDRSSSPGARTLFVSIGFNGVDGPPSTKTGDIYRSTDDGATWTLVLQPAVGGGAGQSNGARVTAVDPFNSNIVYAGGEGGLWKSTTGGGAGSFSALGGVPADFLGVTTGNSIGALRWTGVQWIEMDPNVSGRLYVAAYGDTGSNRGLYRSDNAGSTWTKIYTGDYVRRCAVHPTDPTVLFLGSSRTMTSPAANSFLSKGILKSTDSGTNWVDINDNLGWSLAGPIAVANATSGGYYVYVGSMGNGFQRRLFLATPWTEITGSDGGWTQSLPEPTPAPTAYAELSVGAAAATELTAPLTTYTEITI